MGDKVENTIKGACKKSKRGHSSSSIGAKVPCRSDPINKTVVTGSPSARTIVPDLVIDPYPYWLYKLSYNLWYNVPAAWGLTHTGGASAGGVGGCVRGPWWERGRGGWRGWRSGRGGPRFGDLRTIRRGGSESERKKGA